MTLMRRGIPTAMMAALAALGMAQVAAAQATP